MPNFTFFKLVLLLLTIATMLQSMVLSIPIVLVLLLILYITEKDVHIFLIAFIFGVLLDILYVNTIGQSSLFFVIFLFVVMLYERKFEIHTYAFVALSSFLGSMAFLLMNSYSAVLLQALVTSILALFFFRGVKQFVSLTRDETI